MRDFQVLSELEQVRALAHADRLAMLRLLAERPRTGAQLAHELGMPANRAHYHLKRLADLGLAEPVEAEVRKRRTERYYEASARHYLVDPGLAIADAASAGALLRSLEGALLEYRRREVLAIDLAEVARRIVRDGLGVEAGGRVLVMYGPLGLELAEHLMVEVRAAGAVPVPHLWSRATALAILDRHEPEGLEEYAFLPPEVDAELTAGVYVSTAVPQGAPPAPEQAAKLPLLVQAVSRLHRSIRDRRLPYLQIDLPYRGELLPSAPPEHAIDLFWRSLSADPEEVAERARGVMEALEGESALVLERSGGTRVSVELDLASAAVRDGRISPEDRAAGRTYETLPAGTLALLPRAGSGDGILRPPYALLGGRHLEGLEIELQGGRIAGVRGPDAAFLRERLEQGGPDASRLASLSIGLQPIQQPLCGKPALDAVQDGVVTLSFGNNELLGGDAHAAIELDLPLAKA